MGVGRLVIQIGSTERGLNTFFIRYGCRTEQEVVRLPRGHVSIPSSSGMGVGPTPAIDFTGTDASQYLLHQVWVSDNTPTSLRPSTMSLNTFFIRYGCRTVLCFRRGTNVNVSIPSSSGMGVGPNLVWYAPAPFSLNTFFIRYGCRTNALDRSAGPPRLNTFFIRYGCRTVLGWGRLVGVRSQYLLHQVWVSDYALIQWALLTASQYLLHQVWVSDGALSMGSGALKRLNTFFIRYGCRTLRIRKPPRLSGSQYLLHQVWVSDWENYPLKCPSTVSIPSSSGMGVGHSAKGNEYVEASQYLLHRVWVSDYRRSRHEAQFRGLNTFFIRYGCRTHMYA